MWEITVKKADRLDRVLRGEEFSGAEWMSRAAWEWLISQGFVEVNGRKCLKSGAQISQGAKVVFRFPAETIGLLKSSRPASMLWCDSGLALFSKSCGVNSIPLFPWDSDAFANQVATSLEKGGKLRVEEFAALAEAPSLEGGLLQRLDQDTSGIVTVALNIETKRLFRQLFSEKLVEKTYLALVSGEAKNLQGKFQFWLSGQGEKVNARLQPPKGETEASTLILEPVKSSEKACLIRVLTSQGSRHIVRAGLAALGAPLVGDQLYGGISLAPFHQLHALSLRILRPDAYPAFPKQLEAPLPESFLDSLQSLGLN